ncbi:MAG: hypothetical protein V3U87_01070 [Methylococcaceae bacterium]
MDPELIKTILSAGAVSAIVSGIIGYFTAGRVERIKHQLSANQERSKRLGEAHNNLLEIKQSRVMTRDEVTTQNPRAVLDKLVIAMTNDFDSAETIYKRIRPLLDNKYRKVIDKELGNAEAINNKCNTLLDAEIDKQNEGLIELLEARSSFISILKEQTEIAYEKVSNG